MLIWRLLLALTLTVIITGLRIARRSSFFGCLLKCANVHIIALPSRPAPPRAAPRRAAPPRPALEVAWPPSARDGGCWKRWRRHGGGAVFASICTLRRLCMSCAHASYSCNAPCDAEKTTDNDAFCIHDSMWIDEILCVCSAAFCIHRRMIMTIM